MISFKKYLRNLKRRKKKKVLPGTLTPVERDPTTMPNTSMLPAGTSGNQPRLS